MTSLISNNIRALLINKNMSTDDLSIKSNIEVEKLNTIIMGKALPSLEEVKLICDAFEIPLYWLFIPLPNFLDSWHITIEELGEMVRNNPSLRGFMVGYMAENKIRRFFSNHQDISDLYKPDDHDRSSKCDIILNYRGQQFRFEVKSLQTNTVRNTADGLTAKFQCDAYDRRIIELPNGHIVNTTNLKFGDFDIVAVNLFAFTGNWDYAFALNRDLPHATQTRGKNKNAITKDDLKFLIKTSIEITYPLKHPFVSDPFVLMNQLLLDKH